MRAFLILLVTVFLTACGDDGDGGGLLPPPTSCGAEDQKQFVYDAMLGWYLWNDSLPQSVNLSNYATAEDLLDYLVTFRPATDSQGNPIGRFSFITTTEADQQFYGEGRYEGYGFSPVLGAGETDWQIKRVFEDSPSFRAGMERGQRIIALDGRSIAEIQAAEGTSAVLDAGTADFTLQNLDGSEFTVTITEDIVTIDPVPQWGLIDRPGNSPVGYIELSTFIGTANTDPANFTAAFEAFANANVNDVILDLRYNRGGLVSTAELLANYLGGFVAENLLFSSTEYNADRAAQSNSQTFFSRLGNSLALSRLVVIATREDTASASELVANGLDPHVTVGIVGDRTYGKPVGQVAIDFCEKRLRPTSFQTFNADGFGDYFGGLPADCLADDDLSFAVGDVDNDPNMIAALTWLETGGCPVAAAPGGEFKVGPEDVAPQPDLSGPPHRELANAY
jgi:C-terminal processing protease CtpA/Prc